MYILQAISTGQKTIVFNHAKALFKLAYDWTRLELASQCGQGTTMYYGSCVKKKSALFQGS